MQYIYKFIISAVVLLLAFPIGNLLRNLTQDEQKDGKKYFVILLWISLIIGTLGAIIKRDWMMFTFFFIAIVTSRSLVPKKQTKKPKKKIKK